MRHSRALGFLLLHPRATLEDWRKLLLRPLLREGKRAVLKTHSKFLTALGPAVDNPGRVSFCVSVLLGGSASFSSPPRWALGFHSRLALQRPPNTTHSLLLAFKFSLTQTRLKFAL